MKLRILFLAVCGIILAGIIHISIILLVPDYGSRDAWNIISSKSDMWVFRKISDPEEKFSLLEDTDPYLKMGACTFDLSQAGLHFTGVKSNAFWSLSVFDQDGTVIYSLNNRTAIEGQLDLIVLSPVQMIALRETPPKEIERSIVVEAEIKKGFAVLRQFYDTRFGVQASDNFFDEAGCQRFES